MRELSTRLQGISTSPAIGPFFFFVISAIRSFLHRVSNYQTVLIDLDGTLIDHFNVIYRCYHYALGRMNLPTPSYEIVRGSVGGSMEITMQKFAGPDHHAEAVRLFRERFQRIFLEEIILLAGAEWFLTGLKKQGRKVAVFTNKQGPGSRAICDHLGLSRNLDGVFGSLDTAFRKPDPRLTNHVLSALGSTADEACMIGDSPWDIETARNSGMPCYCVTTGTHERAELEAAGADDIFQNLYALGSAVFDLPVEDQASP